MSCIATKFTQKLLRSTRCLDYVPRVSFHLTSHFAKGYNQEELYKATGNSVYEDYEPGFGRESVLRVPTKKEIRSGTKLIREEFDKWIEERKELLRNDPTMIYEHGVTYRVFSFGRGEDPSKWLTLTDTDEGYGHSTCEFTTSKNGCAVFRGNLSTEVKSDGMSYRSGFCGIRAPLPMKSFYRRRGYDWSQHTHLVLRVRGDGRTYMILLGAAEHLDLTWFSAHSYGLFTRGGPHWQVSKIPFSKFFLTNKGYIQDKQWAPHLCDISSFGISLMDGTDGPFHLEIDYIGIEIDLNHEEDHAYEMYKHDNAIGDC